MNDLRIVMLKIQSIVLCFICGTALFGCAPKGLFYWGDYENSLYERYMENNSAQAENYLQLSIDKAIKENRRVPPGVYADYGFILYQRGDKNSAINFFEKEKQLYPESQALMSKLIERVKQQTIQTGKKTSTNNEVIQ